MKTGKWTKVGKTTEPEFDVTGLINGKEYLFRVVALNEEGESEPLVADHATLIKDPFTTADAPRELQIADWDNKSCDLKWLPPLFDGDAPITNYCIEMKSKIGDWVEVLETDGPQTECKVEGLKEGEQVRFRVRAVNKAGKSKPCEATPMHTVKHRNLKPHIDRTNLVNKTVKMGKSCKFTADVLGMKIFIKKLIKESLSNFRLKFLLIGVPDPEITWVFKGKDQAHEVNVRVHNKENYTEIELSDMQRAQTGLYTVTAKNKNGEDSVTVEITVLSSPSKPSNLVVSDIRKDGCHLSFDKPLDDGKEQQNLNKII